MKKSVYLEQMNRVMDAYTPKRISDFFEDVKAHGMTDHAFPRLTATLGILLSHGYRKDSKDTFAAMMDECAHFMPTTNNGTNDFALREILLCVEAVEQSRLFSAETTARWKAAFANTDPLAIYKVIAPIPAERVSNWAAFNAAGEQTLCRMGIACRENYIDRQLASQVLSFDENGMYRDPDEPMLYDTVTRMLLSYILFNGYNGAFRDTIDENLKKAGKCSLLMQSVTGELAYGGRSNQMLFNEAAQCAVLEYEARRYHALGDTANAENFKRAAAFSAEALSRYLQNAPLSHVKNNYPAESNTGCEIYAHFDKYMVTTASFLYIAYLFADDGIAEATSCTAEQGRFIFRTGDCFHKVFINAFDYLLEIDTRADRHYDCTGLGRVHKKGAPAALCLSVPCPKEPYYKLPMDNHCPFAVAGGLRHGGQTAFACEENALWTLTDTEQNAERLAVTFRCDLPSYGCFHITYALSNAGVDITAAADSDVIITLPVFDFDGQTHTAVTKDDSRITVTYAGHSCAYISAHPLTLTNDLVSNRNGLYRAAYAKNRVGIEIV